MPYRLTKIYTRKGDEGYTHLGDQYLSKDEALVEALGTVDELNSQIGFLYSLQIKDKDVNEILTQIQHDLFDLGGELHLPERRVISAEKVLRLEHCLDTWNAELLPLTEFILPRGNIQTASCHIVRAVCRRAERKLVHLHRQKPLQNLILLKYLNRLSDLFFVLARKLAQETQESEVLWKNEAKK